MIYPAYRTTDFTGIISPYPLRDDEKLSKRNASKSQGLRMCAQFQDFYLRTYQTYCHVRRSFVAQYEESISGQKLRDDPGKCTVYAHTSATTIKNLQLVRSHSIHHNHRPTILIFPASADQSYTDIIDSDAIESTSKMGQKTRHDDKSLLS